MGRKPHKIELTCPVCQEIFLVIPSSLKYKKKYCSLNCANEGQKGTGIYINQYGYVLVRDKDHPGSNKFGFILLHRKVMEMKLGRRLLHGEIVHHVNGNKQDNRPENLEVYKNISEHLKLHHPKGKPVAEHRRKKI